ncbi:MAG: RNA polymerase sigma factor [Acidobacteriota bacterium]
MSDLDQLLARGYRYALSLTHDHARAEDLVQDAWLSILEREAPRHVGYFFRTIRNRFLDLEKRRRLVAVEPLDESVEVGVEPVSIDVEDVERGLGTLRALEREALYLSAVEGHTVAEVATLTDQPLGSVSSLIQRGRAKLRRFLSQERRHG